MAGGSFGEVTRPRKKPTLPVLETDLLSTLGFEIQNVKCFEIQIFISNRNVKLQNVLLGR